MEFVLALTTAVLAFLFVAKAALADFSRSRLEAYCSTRRAERLGRILSHDDDTSTALRAWVWLTVATAAFGLSFWPERFTELGPLSWSWRLLAAVLTIVGVELVFARPLGRFIAEPFLYWTWPVLTVLRLVMTPLLVASAMGANVFARMVGRDAADDHSPLHMEILTVVNESEREGEIREDAVDMIEGLMELPDVAVRDVMTPRTDMVMLKMTATIEEAGRIILEQGHSRIPVYGETRDDIRGVLYAKDLMPFLGVGAAVPSDLSELTLRKPAYVPETKPVDVLLREFQRERVHIAIVTDEYGGVAGLVTIEDILEEIVGEIEDEHDAEESPSISRLSEDSIEVDGRLRVDEVNALLPLQLPEDTDFATIGGYIFARLGRIPKPGESFAHDGARFTVLDATDRAIQRLRIEKQLAPEPA